jgi:hypothetical protein
MNICCIYDVSWISDLVAYRDSLTRFLPLIFQEWGLSKPLLGLRNLSEFDIAFKETLEFIFINSPFPL